MSDDLRPLNRIYRVSIGVAFLLVVVLLAVATATPGGGPGAEGPLGADGPLGSGGPLGESGAAGGALGEQGSGKGPGAKGVADGGLGGASGGGGSGGSQPGASQPGASQPGASGNAPAAAGPSEQGVSDDTIKIAFTRINPDQGRQYGIPDAHQREAILAYVDYVNDRGGINGRAIEPITITQDDSRYEEDGQQTCRTAFVEHKAFMMINDNRWPGIVECAVRLGRPISDLGQGILGTTSAGFLDQLAGRYWTLGMENERLATLWVDYVRQHFGRLKVGIIEHYNSIMIQASKAVQAALARAGFPKPSVYRHTADVSTAAVQASNMTSQFQRDDVKLIMPVTTAVAVGLAQQGFTSRNYYPKWTFSAFGQLDSTDYAHLYNNRQFNGATGVTFGRLPEQPGQESCRKIFTQRYPDLEYDTTQSVFCHQILLNAEVLRRAGGQLTLGTWARAFASIGAWKGNHTPVSTYTQQKFDGADMVQVLRYRDGDMEPVSGFVRDF